MKSKFDSSSVCSDVSSVSRLGNRSFLHRCYNWWCSKFSTKSTFVILAVALVAASAFTMYGFWDVEANHLTSKAILDITARHSALLRNSLSNDIIIPHEEVSLLDKELLLHMNFVKKDFKETWKLIFGVMHEKSTFAGIIRLYLDSLVTPPLRFDISLCMQNETHNIFIYRDMNESAMFSYTIIESNLTLGDTYYIGDKLVLSVSAEWLNETLMRYHEIIYHDPFISTFFGGKTLKLMASQALNPVTEPIDHGMGPTAEIIFAGVDLDHLTDLWTNDKKSTFSETTYGSCSEEESDLILFLTNSKEELLANNKGEHSYYNHTIKNLSQTENHYFSELGPSFEDTVVLKHYDNKLHIEIAECHGADHVVGISKFDAEFFNVKDDWYMVLAFEHSCFLTDLKQAQMNSLAFCGIAIFVLSLIGVWMAIIAAKKVTRVSSKSEGIDLDARIEKILNKLKAVRTSTKNKREKRLLKEVMHTLSAHAQALFAPEIHANDFDDLTKKWIDQQLLAGDAVSFSGDNLLQLKDFTMNHKRKSSSNSMSTTVNELTEKSIEILSTLDNWDVGLFNLFDELDQYNILEVVSMKVLKLNGIFTRFHIDEERMREYIVTIEQKYYQNPYHNAIHATDVVQCVHYCLKNGLAKSLGGNHIYIFSLIFAAIVHDVGHPGFNNSFLNSTNHEIALTHNDISVLENHHASVAWKLLYSDFPDILECFTEEEKKQFRQTSVKCILATDMSNHFEITGKFRAASRSSKFSPSSNAEDRLLMCQVILKFADVSNPARPPHNMKEWTDRLVEEFYKQGDAETKRNLPISAFMNRNKSDVPNLQKNFVCLVCQPLYESLVNFIDMDEPLQHLEKNIQYWLSKIMTQTEINIQVKHTANVTATEENV